MRLLSKEHLNAWKAASTDATRYVLNGVFIEETEKGVRATATDGRRLVTVESEDKEGMTPADFPAVPGMETAPNGATAKIIPSESIKSALKSLPKANRVKLPILQKCLVKLGENQATLATTDLSNASVQPSRIIDGNFPNYKAVIPTKTPILKMGLSPELLGSLCEVLASNAGDDRAVVFEFYGPEEPVKMTVTNREGITTTAVLMPVKLPK